MLRSLLLTLFLGIAFFSVERLGYGFYVHPWINYMLLFFLAVSFLIHRLMEFGFRDKREKFVEFYLSTVVGRLLLCIAFVAVALYMGVGNAPVFIVNFFALYLFYTVFEIYGLYRTLRRDS